MEDTQSNFLLFLFVCWERIILCCSDCLRTLFVDQTIIIFIHVPASASQVLGLPVSLWLMQIILLIFGVTFIFMHIIKLCVHAKFSLSVCLLSNTKACSICWVIFIVQRNYGFIVSQSCVQDFVLFNLCF